MQVSENKQVKINLVEKTADLYNASEWIFVINYTGLNAMDLSKLRSELRKSNCNLIIVKNSLNKMAIKQAGFPEYTDGLSGQNATIICKDVIAGAKILNSYIDNGKISAIYYSNKSSIYGNESISDLAKLPPLEVMRAKLLGSLNSVPSALVRTLLEPSSSLVRLCNARSKV